MSLTIKLADQNYVIEALTVGQLADLHVCSNEPQLDINTPEGARSFWIRNIGVLAAGLGKSTDEIKNTKLGGFKEVSDAVTDILVFSGIWSRVKASEGATPGEVKAAA